MSREFIARRLHSLAGFFFLVFLCNHLFTNSQAALLFGDDGIGFIHAVNWIHSLPYLQVIELTFIGLPVAVHTWWGIERLHTAKINSTPSDGSKPSLPYKRNIAFTWQRITSVVLIVAIGLHIFYMRFYEKPESVQYGLHSEHFVRLQVDPGLQTIAPRLNIKLFDKSMIDQAEAELKRHPFSSKYDAELVAQMKKLSPGPDQVVAMCDSFGVACLMMIRDTFKSVWVSILYSIFVILACFHACNGLWTFSITWGVTLSERSRVVIRVMTNLLMALLIFLGLACIWGVYWINLRY